MKVKAEIKNAKGKNALWLIVDRVKGRVTTAGDLDAIFDIRSEDDGNVAYAVLSTEVQAIRDACEVWLEKESQRIMKEGISKS